MLPLLLLLCLMPFGDAQGEQQPSAFSEDDYVVPSSIKGRVVDSGEEPLWGIEVILAQTRTGLKQSILTDRNGMYHFDCLKEGQYSLTFKSEGFITERMDSFTYRSPASLTFDRKLEIDPGFGDSFIFGEPDKREMALTVLVKDSRSSENLGNVQIEARDSNGILAESPVTDKCGIARVFLKAKRSYSVRISRDGFKEKEINLDMHEKPENLKISLDPIK